MKDWTMVSSWPMSWLLIGYAIISTGQLALVCLCVYRVYKTRRK